MDGGDCNIPDAFLKKRGDNNNNNNNNNNKRFHPLVSQAPNLEIFEPKVSQYDQASRSHFSCSTQLSMKLQLLVKLKCWKKETFLAFKRSDIVLIIIIISAFFFFRIKGYINFVSKSVRRPSVCPCVCPSVTFLVNVSSPKPLEVATSNFVD